jgi:hypothetical protein
MDFETILHQLASARSQYEAMRSSGAPIGALVDARADLLHLRAEMARIRREGR